MAEEVLVFSPSILCDDFVGISIRGITTDPVVIRRCMEALAEPNTCWFMDREEAEHSPNYLQLIPYCVLRRGREIFRYRRTKKGGESRLHDFYSIGVGGHINPGDSDGFFLPYSNGCRRELLEEVGYCPDNFNAYEQASAIIHDNSTEVGRVHFGIVHEVVIPPGTSLKLEDSLSDGEFVHVLDLNRRSHNYEVWSNLVIEKVLGHA